MKLLQCLFALACILAVPVTTAGDKPAGETPSGDTPDKTRGEARKPRVKAPKAAIQQAVAYLDSLPAAQQPKDREDAIDDFLSSFFLGFRDSTNSMAGGTEADHQGLKAGQAYRRANPGKLKEVMEGFGYTATEAEGVWTEHFEHSGFVPRKNPKERWWLSTMEGTESNVPEESHRPGDKIPEKGVAVRIIGFLSPAQCAPGFGYGHLNLFDREIYATKITKLNGG